MFRSSSRNGRLFGKSANARTAPAWSRCQTRRVRCTRGLTTQKLLARSARIAVLDVVSSFTTKKGKLISIEGDPESPISQGNLCPKGAASYQLLTHSQRETKIKYRAPRAKQWTEISMDRAMDMVADRVWESRKRTFVRQENGVTINHTTAICHLGGATLDNEENYLIKKLFTGGLGMVCVSNQARI